MVFWIPLRNEFHRTTPPLDLSTEIVNFIVAIIIIIIIIIIVFV